MKLVLTFIVLSLSSCAIFIPKKESEHHIYPLLTKKTTRFSTDQIQSILTKSHSMAGGNYQISAFPLTQSYIHSKVRDLTNNKHLTKEQQLALTAQLEKRWILDKTCMQFHYEVVRFDQAKNLKDWQLTLIDSNKVTSSLNWEKMPVPIQSEIQRQEGKLEKWINDGVACTSPAVDLTAGFSLKVRPSFVQWPFQSEKKMAWNFSHYKKDEGKKILIPKKKQVKERYRGW